MTTHEQRRLPTTVSTAVAGLERTPIPITAKGFGPYTAQQALSAESLARGRPGLHSGRFSFPLLTLRDSAVTHNVLGMADYCAEAGVLLAPHGKTMMSPQLAARQLAAGAWAISVATISQLQTYRAFGFTRLLLANELVDRAGIRWLAAERRSDPSFEVYCYVDSLAGVELLDNVLGERGPGRPLPVLIELGHAGGRTGARSSTAALQIARAAAATGTLEVAGAAGYEGGLGHHADPQTLTAVRGYCGELRRLVTQLSEEGIVQGKAIVSAGGSAFFDIVVSALTAPAEQILAPWVVLRSGAYITHDHGFYKGISPVGRSTAGVLSLRPALELWAPVLSRPEPTLALLQMGRRDVSFDEGLPVPLRIRRHDGRETDASKTQVTALNDQHGYLKVSPGLEIEPGDLVSLGISHPCTTFDKWPVIAMIDDADRVISAVHTFF